MGLDKISDEDIFRLAFSDNDENDLLVLERPKER